jgi:CheY-like chemotaxis protein
LQRLEEDDYMKYKADQEELIFDWKPEHVDERVPLEYIHDFDRDDVSECESLLSLVHAEAGVKTDLLDKRNSLEQIDSAINIGESGNHGFQNKKTTI